MNNNPIINEPGFETSSIKSKRAVDYIEYVRYNNYSFALLNMIKNDNFFPYFNNIVKEHFKKNYEKIMKKLKKLTKLDGKIMKTPIWCKQVKVNYTELIKEFEKEYSKL